MEKVFIAKSRNTSDTLICGTRYGNVMCSRGSVIPLFIEQLKAGNSLTVTNPDMTRYIMSLEEAVELVIFAFKNANQGDIMIQKAPACTIGDLAVAVTELFDSDIPIKTIGIRHGEKMYETLLTKEEASSAIDLGRFYRMPADTRDLNYEKYMSQGSIRLFDEYNSNNTKRLCIDEIKEKLLALEYIQNELKEWEK